MNQTQGKLKRGARTTLKQPYPQSGAKDRFYGGKSRLVYFKTADWEI